MSDENENDQEVDFEALLDSLSETPNKLATLTDGLSDAELCLKYSVQEFSVIENFCHLRDLELQGYARRINRIVDENDPLLPDFDGARVAAEGNYNSQPADIALQVFRRTRKENVERLRGLNVKELRRAGTLEGVGKITLKRLAEMMHEHDEGHLEDLRVLRQQLEKYRSSSFQTTPVSE